ncbi:MAG: glycosyltransferase [Treponema sp.]|nr:glycosyltransferase [Treponema sp.]
MKVAIVHDWLVNYGGAERVVESLLSLYPNADIYTLVYDKKKMASHFPPEQVHTSFVQKIPFATKLYTKLLSLMPKAFEQFDFSGYDVVICSSSSCAKGVITPPDVPHLAYVHTPMRYAWDQFFAYRSRSGKLTRFFMDRWMPQIRLWDYVSSQRIDRILCNSSYIQRRIQKYWNRSDAVVVYPPVDTLRLSPNGRAPEDFYVVFSRFVTYKRIDLAIQACGKTGRRLVVIGSGSEEKALKALAAQYKDSHITFTGRISDEKVKDYLQRCRALLFCAEEDFGIIPVEAQACGRPVIAFGKGGALETVVDGKTGLFFKEQTPESLIDALNRFEKLDDAHAFETAAIVSHASTFSVNRFLRQMQEQVNTLLDAFGKKTAGEATC